MKWIREHKCFALLFAGLIASVIILVLTFAIGKSGAGVLNTLYIRLEKPMTAWGASIRKNVTGVFSYRSLMEENQKLREENTALQEEVRRSTLSQTERTQLEDLAKALNYSFVQSGDNIIACDIVSLDGTNWMNAFTVDRGEESGIKAGDIVLAGEGLVGVIKDVGPGWAKVTPIVDEAMKISFTVNKNADILGILEGAEDGSLSGYLLNNKANVSEGDLLYTSGMGKYPAGVLIGRISKTVYDSDKQLLTVQVKPDVAFRSLTKVSVIL